MKKLQTLKAVDFYGQMAMFVMPLLTGRFWSAGVDFLPADIAFAVGGWQLLSFIIHLTQLKKPWIAKGRRTYGIWILALIAAGAIASLTQDVVVLIYFILLIPVSIFLSLYYFAISYSEWVAVRALRKPEGDTSRPF